MKMMFVPYFINRFLNLFSHEYSVNLAGPYLILNTSDGVLFPIGFIIQNSIVSQLMKLLSENKPNANTNSLSANNDVPMEFLEKRDEEDE